MGNQLNLLDIHTRDQWRSWLIKHHKQAKEVWLIYYKKSSGKPRVAYNHAVEEALCYGWIDSTVKSIDQDRFAQRFTPRRPKSNVSQMNKERIRRLIKQKKMTKAGLRAVEHAFKPSTKEEILAIADDVLQALKKDKLIWKNFNQFPASYKRIRISFIELGRTRPDVFQKRLNYFLKMTAKNKQYGMVK